MSGRRAEPMTRSELTWLLLLAGTACLGGGVALRVVGVLGPALLLVLGALAFYCAAFRATSRY